MTTLEKASPKQVTTAFYSYASLRDRVKKTLLEGQQKIEKQKVLTYWETGKQLHEHIFAYEARAEQYGKSVVEKLAKDLDLSSTLLYQCLQFYRSFKNLHARVNSSLTWAHYRAAMRIPEEKRRLAVIEQASEDEWTSRELEIKVRNYNWSERIWGDGKTKPPRLPLVCLGPFYTYKVIRPETIHSRSQELLLDLGFSHVLEMNLFEEKFAAGTIVTSAKKTGPLVKAEGAAEDSLYTYKAYVEKVIDGDTLKVEFELGFGNRKRETIRLNHIDCPPIDTPEGRAAKRFVESQLSACEFITIKSVRTRKEKFGRYLGDVFFSPRPTVYGRAATKQEGKIVGRRLETSTSMIYLNQLLLDKGYAVRVRM